MSTGATFESFEKELGRLVAVFERNLPELKRADYVEAKLREDFLNLKTAVGRLAKEGK